MRQFTLDLDVDSQRPIIHLDNWYNFRALLDTGAEFPVWAAAESTLSRIGGKLIKTNVPYSGFGGLTKGNLYEIPVVQIGDLIFPNIHIITSSELRNVPYYMILSATMFRGLIYEIDDFNHKLNITIPDKQSNVRNLVIEDRGGKLHVLCQSANVEPAFVSTNKFQS